MLQMAFFLARCWAVLLRHLWGKLFTGTEQWVQGVCGAAGWLKTPQHIFSGLDEGVALSSLAEPKESLSETPTLSEEQADSRL